MVPDGQQVHGRIVVHDRIEQKVVPMQILTQRVRRARWQSRKPRQGLRRLWRVGEVTPADARKPAEVRDDRRPQFIEQRIESKAGVRLVQERSDGIQAFQEARRQFDPSGLLTPAS
jgi:hypothetical protein